MSLTHGDTAVQPEETQLTEFSALERILGSRYSCRAFRPDPVPEETLALILRLAQRTASWCNAQPWQVIMVSGTALEHFREALTAGAASGAGVYDIDPPAAYIGVYKDRRRTCGYALYDSVGITRDDRARRIEQAMENYRFFGAPHVAIVTSAEELGAYGYVDCGAYVANLMSAAESLGVATIAQASIANFSNVVREEFGIPADRRIVCGVSLGFADAAHPVNTFRTERASLDETVKWVS